MIADTLKKKNKFSRLEFLDMSTCNLGVPGSEFLSLALMQNKCLEELVLSGPRNYVGVAGSCVLASALLENFSLKRLWLDKNNIAFEGVTAIMETLQNNQTLEFIDLSQNMLGDRAGGAIDFTLTTLAGEGRLGSIKRLNMFHTKFTQKFVPSWNRFIATPPFNKIMVSEDPDILHSSMSLCGKAEEELGHIVKKDVVRDAENLDKVINLCTSGHANRVAKIDMSGVSSDKKSGNHQRS